MSSSIPNEEIPGVCLPMKFATNPLPGMNPWLEAYWGDIHTSMTTYARDAIQKQLPDKLQARVEEYLSVEDVWEDRPADRRIAPDVHIVEQGSSGAPERESAAVQTMVAEEPVRILRSIPPQTLRYIKIVDLKSRRRVITVIEFLSLANKATAAGRKQYRQKQRELLEAGVNLVEIDLLRSGKWVLATKKTRYPERYRGPYRIGVVRAVDPEIAEIYHATFTAPLPKVFIPLRKKDKDVLLPLQELVNQAYENGRYGNDVDYSVPPQPPLPEAEQRWVSEYLAKRLSIISSQLVPEM